MPHEGHLRYVPEPAAVATRGVAWAAGGALLLLAGAIVVFTAIYQHAVPVRTMPAPQAFPQPRVDTADAETLRQLHTAQAKQLETWRWADDRHTLVQIPIERAMQLLAQKGAAAYDPLLPPQQEKQP
jgi:hypothetical protein